MPRLYRPTISVAIKCRVVLRQLGEMFVDDVIAANRFVPRDHRKRSLGRLLDEKLAALAELLRCEVTELRLDHDPALAIRKKLYLTPNGGHVWTFEILKEGEVVRYEPDANDPAHLRYRPHAAQHAGSHHVKTNIRGDGAQHPDRVLIKRLRKRKGDQRIKRHVAFRGKNKVTRKQAWPTGRKLQGRPFERKKR